MVQTVAENLVSLMAEAGVKRIYGIVGDSANALVDAIHRSSGKICFINVRNEEAGAFAAGADASISGTISAVFGSCGPGSLHLLNGLYDCCRNSASVFAIATHIPSEEINTQYFQETRPDQIFPDCCQYLGYAMNANQMPRLTELAIQAALLERGVGMVILPGDICSAIIEKPKVPHPLIQSRPLIQPSENDLEKLARFINSAQKVAIYGGAGCKNGREAVLALSQKVHAPVGFAFRGKDILEADNPNSVGMIGLLGWGAAKEALRQCDLLLILGADFPFEDDYPQNTTIVQIDDTALHLGRRARVNQGLIGDIKTTLDILIPLIEQKTDSSFLDTMRALNTKMMRLLAIPLSIPQGNKPLSPELVTHTLSVMADKDAIFTADTGMCVVWASRYLHMAKDQRLLASYSHGSMANALPQAIGAALSSPEKQVIALCGDGGLTMLMGELLTTIEQNVPVKLMVFNNSSRAMVDLEMKSGGYQPWGTCVKNPDFGAVARSIGLYGERVEKADDIENAISRAFNYPGPALIDFVTDPAVAPPSPDTMLKQLEKNG